MTVVTRAQAQAAADTIASEVIEGRNTAARVGGLLRDIADSMALEADPVDPTGLVVSGTPANGDFVRYANGEAYWGSDQDYNITSFAAVGSTLLQVGAALVNPAYTAAHTVTPTSLVLTDSEGTAPKNVVGTPTSFSNTLSVTKNTPNATYTATLTGSDGISPSVATRVHTWCQRVYYGAAVPGTFNAAFIQGLASNNLQTTGNRTFSLAATATQKKYFAFPTRLGSASVVIGGFTYSWTVISTTISVTNSDGFTENYTLIENENLGVPSETIQVTVS